MLKQILAVLAVISSAGCGSVNEPPREASVNVIPEKSAIAGAWSGVLDLGAMKLTMVFAIGQDSQNVKMSCLEQGLADLPTEVKWQSNAVQFGMPKLGASYEGSFNSEKTEINGKFTQNGASFPLTLKKGEILSIAQPLRPQEPKQPYPYAVEEVRYDNANAEVTLAGTLTLPRSEKPFPAVLLIAGSGPNNRDEKVFGHKPFLVLADHLTKQGMAVLRVDKRGVGESTGSYDTATAEDFASDVLAGIAYLKTRKEIDAKQIGLIGHSEGGIVAPMVADKSHDVAFIVLMAGPGVNGEEIMYEQGALIARAVGAKEEQIEVEISLQKQLFSVIKNEPDFTIAEEKLHEVISKYVAGLPEEQRNAHGGAIEAQVKRINTKPFRYFLTYDPATSLKQVKIPVLALNGELDLQVPPGQNLPVISNALKEAGNSDYATMELPKLNHLFQTAETGSIAEYGKVEETIAPVALDAITEWILRRTIKKT